MGTGGTGPPNIQDPGTTSGLVPPNFLGQCNVDGLVREAASQSRHTGTTAHSAAGLVWSTAALHVNEL